jgi:serine/threonine protein kinase
LLYRVGVLIILPDMRTSGELREHRFSPERENPEKEIARTDDDVIEKIEEIFNEGRKDIVGSGRSADVVILDIWANVPEGKTPWVIKQENRRTREQESLNTSLENELRLQAKAYTVIERARAENPEKPFARVAEPLKILTQPKNGKKWLIMEFIEGESLFERAMRQVLLAYNEDEAGMPKENINKLKKDELIDLLSDDEYRNLLPPRILEELNNGGELDEQHFLPIALLANRVNKGASPVINATQYAALSNTISELHKHRLWHRDLHASNVQVEPNGNIALLDFGLSLERTPEEALEGTGIYTVDLGNAFHERVLRLPSDEDMLAQYEKVSRKIK